MPFPKPYFRVQRGTWAVQIDGRQISLGKDKEAAMTLYHKLMGERQELPKTVLGSPHVVALLDLFLTWCQDNKAKRTYDWYFRYLQSFNKSIPDSLTVSDLKPFHVQQWVDKQKGWKTGWVIWAKQKAASLAC